MKSSWVRGLLILSVFFSLALKKDDVVELEQFLNARESADFLKTTQNVKFVLPPGTQAKIEKVKTFNSGNHGLYVTLQTGDSKGEKVWIYYRDEKPGMKLFEGEAAKSAATTDVEKAKSAEMTEPTTAWRTPAGEKIPLVVTKEYAEKLMKQVDNVNAKIKVADTKNNQPCDDNCKLAQQTYGRDLPKPEDEETKELAKPKPAPKRKPVLAAGVRDENAQPVAIVKEKEAKVENVNFVPPTQDPATLRQIPNTENRQRINFPSCSNIYNDNLEVCTQPGYGKTGVKITNYSPGYSAAAGKAKAMRTWDVLAPSAARQDASIWIYDDPGKRNPDIKTSVIMLFPRTSMPAVQPKGNQYVVTLPSGETATFEKGTGRVVNGVFKEKPQAAGVAPRVTYSGKNLMIRADNNGSDPRIGGGTATVSRHTKNGFKSCEIPKKVLWGQAENSGQGFKFFSDKDLDQYLKANPKCGFGIYD